MKYFEDHNLIIDGAAFTYQGGLFDGKGFLSWNYKNGFKIKLFVESNDYAPPKIQTFGGPKVIKSRERNDIYLSIDSYSFKKAIVPNAYLGHQLSIDHTGTLAFNTPQLIFLKENFIERNSYWTGSGIYRLKKQNYSFPKKLHKKEKIGDEELRKGWNRTGIQCKSKDKHLIAWVEDDEYLHLKFGLKKEKYSQAVALNFPCGFRLAISFLIGMEVMRLKSEVNGKNSNVVVLKKLREVKEMPVYSGLDSFQFFDSQIVWDLSLFFTRGYLDIYQYRESYVARRILNQLIEAEQQKTLIAQELLTATILEAALRTLFDVPFLDGSKSDFQVENYLKNNFIKKYADGRKWRTVRKKVAESFNRMRHRNAHPDWLVGENDVHDDKNISNTFHDLRIMIRFYQQMILLMAGIKDIDPNLPYKI